MFVTFDVTKYFVFMFDICILFFVLTPCIYINRHFYAYPHMVQLFLPFEYSCNARVGLKFVVHKFPYILLFLGGHDIKDSIPIGLKHHLHVTLHSRYCSFSCHARAGYSQLFPFYDDNLLLSSSTNVNCDLEKRMKLCVHNHNT